MVYAGRHARQKSARSTGDRIGSIYLRSPIRWQSPIYIESAQRPRPRSEHEKSRAHPDGARPARDGSPLEDTIMLVAVTTPPSGSQPPREPPSREITAHSLEEEDSLDADDHQERMRRLSGSIYLDFPP